MKQLLLDGAEIFLSKLCGTAIVGNTYLIVCMNDFAYHMV